MMTWKAVVGCTTDTCRFAPTFKDAVTFDDKTGRPPQLSFIHSFVFKYKYIFYYL